MSDDKLQRQKDRSELAGDEHLAQAIMALPQEIAPETDLWPDITARLDASAAESGPARRNDMSDRPVAPQRRWMPLALAASLIVTAVSLSFAVWQASQPAQVIVQQVPVTQPQLLQVTYLSDSRRGEDDGAAWVSQYELARSSYLQRWAMQKEHLEPTVVSDVEANLKVIRNAINDIERALQKQPHNYELQQLLRQTYEQELALLQQLSPGWT